MTMAHRAFRRTLSGLLMGIVLGSAAGCEAPDQASSELIYCAEGSPYSVGALDVEVYRIDVEADQAPRPMLLFLPQGLPAGKKVPVVVYHHGFMGQIDHAEMLLAHLASQGFVVVAPQMYSDRNFYTAPKTPEEAEAALEVHAWLAAQLSAFCGDTADLSRLGLVGHSRGGKLVWWLIERLGFTAQALAGLDPVDGTFDYGVLEGEPRLIDGPFRTTLPGFLLGTGLGAQPIEGTTMGCAPEGDNHLTFLEASPSPTFHALAPDHGHDDVLDTDRPVGQYSCPAGEAPESLLATAQGLVSAFFRLTLQGDEASRSWLTGATAAPARLVLTQK